MVLLNSGKLLYTSREICFNQILVFYGHTVFGLSGGNAGAVNNGGTKSYSCLKQGEYGQRASEGIESSSWGRGY
jgi:hypothetical protein